MLRRLLCKLTTYPLVPGRGCGVQLLRACADGSDGDVHAMQWVCSSRDAEGCEAGTEDFVQMIDYSVWTVVQWLVGRGL